MPEKQLASTTHSDTRVNIPTEELRDLVDEQEKRPQTLLYPRDPSLDPQLVWRGKDEQDRKPLEVPAVPIYIQEEVRPQAIIEDLRALTASKAPVAEQLGLFADPNQSGPLEKLDFYNHGQDWRNRVILGDSQLVMASLAEKEGLKGKVQMIYMDPPYGIKFGSNWQVSTRKRDVRDGNAADVNREPEVIRAFRDTWQLGIHSYLSYLRDRLVLARELLTESGSVFVQIGDENVHLVRSVMDEVFGAENLAGTITFVKTSAQEDLRLPAVCDFVLWYSLNLERMKYRQLWLSKGDDDAGTSEYNRLELSDGLRRRMSADEELAASNRPPGSRAYRQDNFVSQRPPGDFPVDFEGSTFRPITGYWKTGVEGMSKLSRAGRVERRGRMLSYVRFLDDFPVRPLANFWPDVRFSSRAESKTYVVQTSARVIERCVIMSTDPGELVLDPTCGSGTTAYVAEQWGRRWITTDTSRVALALARTRLMAGRFPYYHLADSPEGVKKEAEVTGQVPPPYKTANDIKKGFVYKRVPHITLKAIANNEEIDVIHERHQPRLTELLGHMNGVQGVTWQEWEVPRELPSALKAQSSVLEPLLSEWWKVRRERQADIDASIARRADVELLYDQPYEDNTKIRVTGPFTVESLSPHRMISVEDKVAAAEDGVETAAGRVAVEVKGPDDFGLMIIDHLRKTGVQNGIKRERLTFERLDPFPGEWIHAAGEYLEDGSAKRVAVCIGPEFGTVGPDLVKEAAKEAVRGVGFDLVLICGFAFDPHVSEEAKRYGSLTVLPTKMNPDLAMGDELLKKTGAGNLFMVFGEPDITTTRVGNDEFTVEIHGLDVYDPTTGVIRNSSTDDIACWFIDTNYNSESFFVRHAYFTGGDKPYERLQRTLRAEIDEDAWSTLYSTRSRPFPRPSTGKIAVKVINHYGDEVLKVYEV